MWSQSFVFFVKDKISQWFNGKRCFTKHLLRSYLAYLLYASFFVMFFAYLSSVVQPTKRCGSTFPFSLCGLSCHVPCFPATSTQREKFSQDARNSRPREDREVTRMQHFRLQSSTLVPALTCTWAALGEHLTARRVQLLLWLRKLHSMRVCRNDIDRFQTFMLLLVFLVIIFSCLHYLIRAKKVFHQWTSQSQLHTLVAS